jgi:NADP-dependent alcohol dehydrogenase
MLPFEYYNPTRIIFGENQLHRLPELISELNVNKVMLAYGKGSIKNNGILSKIKSQLGQIETIEFGGIEANPEYSTLMKAVEMARENRIDFILAIGGGSVIDGVKFISGAVHYSGEPWDVLERKKGCAFTTIVPFGTYLTLPATGSEANSGAVISRNETKGKRTMGGPSFFPLFSFCDPSVVASLPKRQIANGIVDTFMHVLEQYLTYPVKNLIQEREAEAILHTVIEISEQLLENPTDIILASNLMICATHALNGNLRCGVPTDWSTHMIGHELTAHFGIDHARSLAIIAPRLYENQFESKKEMLCQFGKRIWSLTGNNDEIARNAIVQTESFFNSIGVKTKISQYTDNYEGIAEKISSTFKERGWTQMGESKLISPAKITEIVKSAY